MAACAIRRGTPSRTLTLYLDSMIWIRTEIIVQQTYPVVREQKKNPTYIGKEATGFYGTIPFQSELGFL